MIKQYGDEKEDDQGMRVGPNLHQAKLAENQGCWGGRGVAKNQSCSE